MGVAKTYEIKARTFEFAVAVVRFTAELPRSTEGTIIARQLMRAGTAVGANVEEANGARTKKEFINSMNIARREARETHYWLRVIQGAGLVKMSALQELLAEADELVRILVTIVKRAEGHS